MISPRIGRHARARRSARVIVVSALAFGLVCAPQLITPTSAVADTAPAEDGAVELSVASGLHGVVRPGAPFATVVTVDNGTDQPVDAGRITLELNRTPLADTDALTAWLDTGAADGDFAVLSTDASDSVMASDSTTTSISTSSASLGELPEGVYPIRATLSVDSSSDTSSEDPAASPITATSVVVVSAESARTVTVLVPITATPEGGALLTADELVTLPAPDGALTAQLDGVAGTSAALAIDPLIPAAIRALGTAAPTSATAWLTRLDALSNERFALQAGDADATVQARAGLTAMLEPLPLTSLLDEANFAGPSATPTPSQSPSPSPSSTPDLPEVPSYEDLTALRNAEPGILWPVSDVQTADLSVFDEFLGTDTTTILPTSALAAASSALVEVDGRRVLAMDAAASATLSDAVATTDRDDREREIAAGIAELTYAGAQTSLLVGLERNETRTDDALRETILSLSAIAQPTALTTLRASEPASSTLIGETSTDRAGILTNLLADEKLLTAFSSILDDPLVLLSPERMKIMRLIGVGSANALPQASVAHRTETTATLSAVGVQQPSPIQLFTAAAPLPVWVHNDLPWPVNVTLLSHPSDARLYVQPSTPVEGAQPASNSRVKVPVESRVGSGELTVDFSLVSPTGVHIGIDQTAAVTVRAEWEGIGLGILGGVIGLLLILGIIRTIVRRRTEREADAAGDADAVD